jgi:hypothetical protein
MVPVITVVIGLMALLCGGIAAAMARWALMIWKSIEQFRKKGVPVKGRVAHKESKERYVADRSGGRHVTEYFVGYRYDYNGQSYTGEQPVTEGSYKAWSEGSSIDVTILSNNPAQSRLTTDNYVPGFFIGLIIGAITLALAAIALIVIAFVFVHNPYGRLF